MALSLFIADLDGTLIPNSGITPAKGGMRRTLRLLEELQETVILAYASSRNLQQSKKVQKTFHLPEPNYWICNLGTEIYAKNKAIKEWERTMGEPIQQRLIRQKLLKINGITYPADKQSDYKCCMYFQGSENEESIKKIQNILKEMESKLRMVYSKNSVNNKNVLDIIPENAGKGGALLYLKEKNNFSFDEIFFAGDSGTDIDALLCGVQACLVGNADEATRKILQKMITEIEDSKIFFADYNYGDGIMQGLDAYNQLPESLYQ